MRVNLLLTVCLLLATLLPALSEARAWSGDGYFSLIPPSGWSVKKPARNTLLFSSGTAELEIECFSQSVPIKDPSYKDKVRESVDSKEFTVLSQSEITISGMPAIQCELEGVGEKQNLLGRFVVMTDSNRTWFISYAAPRTESAEVFGRVEEALVTLQLK